MNTIEKIELRKIKLATSYASDWGFPDEIAIARFNKWEVANLRGNHNITRKLEHAEMLERVAGIIDWFNRNEAIFPAHEIANANAAAEILLIWFFVESRRH